MVLVVQFGLFGTRLIAVGADAASQSLDLTSAFPLWSPPFVRVRACAVGEHLDGAECVRSNAHSSPLPVDLRAGHAAIDARLGAIAKWLVVIAGQVAAGGAQLRPDLWRCLLNATHLQRDATRCNAMQRNAAQCNAMQRHSTQCNACNAM